MNVARSGSYGTGLRKPAPVCLIPFIAAFPWIDVEHVEAAFRAGRHSDQAWFTVEPFLELFGIEGRRIEPAITGGCLVVLRARCIDAGEDRDSLLGEVDRRGEGWVFAILPDLRTIIVNIDPIAATRLVYFIRAQIPPITCSHFLCTYPQKSLQNSACARILRSMRASTSCRLPSGRHHKGGELASLLSSRRLGEQGPGLS